MMARGDLPVLLVPLWREWIDFVRGAGPGGDVWFFGYNGKYITRWGEQ